MKIYADVCTSAAFLFIYCIVSQICRSEGSSAVVSPEPLQPGHQQPMSRGTRLTIPPMLYDTQSLFYMVASYGK
jgi:hypothetical protein